MRKFFKRIIVIISVAILAITCVACGNNTPAPKKEVLTLNVESLEITVGESYYLTASIKDVEWISEDTQTAKVDSRGKVTGISEGTTTIVVSKNGMKKECSVSVKALEIATGYVVKMSQSNASLQIGDTLSLNAIVYQDSTAVEKTVIFSSSDDQVAEVDAEGTVTAKGAGEVSIIAKYEDSYAVCNLVVSTGALVLTIDKTTVKTRVGAQVQLTAVLTENGVEKTAEIVWSAQNDAVSVNADGTVTAKKSGMSIVVAQCGRLEAHCLVYVEA